MNALSAALERSPELFPHAVDLHRDRVSLVRLRRDDFEEASFLDERVLEPTTLTRALPWVELASAVESGGLIERCHFIFHIGHVGSTLLSRLLGAHSSIFALREPAILRTLAQAKSEATWDDHEFTRRLSVLLRLWSRTFELGQTAVIKATSFVSDIAPDLLARRSQPKAVLLFVKPETYMATILAGANARAEAKTLVEERLKRLHRRLGRNVWQASSLGEGEVLALAWMTEMSALVEAKRVAGNRALLIEFDDFLSCPMRELASAFRHLGSDVPEEAVAAILAGPLMQRYSKAPEHSYSPALRRELLDAARGEHAAEIASGLAWLERAAKGVPEVAAALDATKSR